LNLVFRLQDMQTQPQRGPVARLLVSLLMIVTAVAAFFFGAVLIVILIGVIAILFFVLYLRAWSLRRKQGLNARPENFGKQRDSGVTIEGEYTVQDGDKDTREEN
jgi:hypothetical protein